MKFLTDSQTSAVFVRMLRALGWDVETVYEHGISKERNDANLVGWAHAHDRVFVTFDLLRKEQGAKVARQIRDHGGKVISIDGGPGQAVERSLGRLLFHMPDWEPFLSKHDGRVDIVDLKPCKVLRANKLKTQVRARPQRQFDTYLQNREQARLRPLKPRPRKASKFQGRLDTG